MHAIAAGENFERVIAPEQRVKHAFIHLCMHPEWIDLHLTIDINDRSMCSVNGGNWHDKAVHTVDAIDDNGQWVLTFQDPHSVLKADAAVFTQVPWTNVYLCKGYDSQCNTLLIPFIE